MVFRAFEKDGLEIVSKEDIDDLKLLKATRHEVAEPFAEYFTFRKISKCK